MRSSVPFSSSKRQQILVVYLVRNLEVLWRCATRTLLWCIWNYGDVLLELFFGAFRMREIVNFLNISLILFGVWFNTQVLSGALTIPNTSVITASP